MVEKAETPSTAPDFITNPELEEGIVKGRITTFTVTEENLPDYQNAANDKTKSKVEVIARPGQHYVTEEIKPVNLRRRSNGLSEAPIIKWVKSKFPVREGSIAISLERPVGITNDTAFNLARQQEEVKRLREEDRIEEEKKKEEEKREKNRKKTG